MRSNAGGAGPLSPVQKRGPRTRQGGFSTIEMLIVVIVLMIVTAIAIPNMMNAIADIKLRASANSVSGLLQQARLMAVQKNSLYTVRANGTNRAYIDSIPSPPTAADGSGNGSFDTTEPMVQLGGTSQFAQTGNPAFNNALLGAYTPITGDSPLRVSFNARGLPCVPNGSGCSTNGPGGPVAFLYFITDLRPIGGWAAVSVSPSGRVKVWYYNGTTWQQ